MKQSKGLNRKEHSSHIAFIVTGIQELKKANRSYFKSGTWQKIKLSNFL
jgi:thiamine phosphate synthase YjbQ (UPF0047 family)